MNSVFIYVINNVEFLEKTINEIVKIDFKNESDVRNQLELCK